MSTDPNITSIDSTDPSPYIRTYAKDVAMLTGQKPNTSKPVISQTKTEQEIEEHIQDIGNAASSGILQSISLPSIQPGDIIPGVSRPVEPATVPAPITAPSSTPVAETESREAVLARLRAKVAASRPPQEPLMPASFSSAPAQETPSIEAVVPAVPPILIQPTMPAPMPAPVQAPAPPPAPFHSFSSDFADRIDEQHASAFAVLAAEKDSASQQAATSKKKISLLPILAGIVLVLTGAGGIFAAYRFMTAVAPVVAIPATSYLIVPDEKVALSGAGNTLVNALAQQAEKPLPANTVVLTYIDSATTTAQGTTEVPASGGAFLTALDLPAPDVLLRNVDPSSMVGIVNDGTQTRAFFILRVDSYQSTFAGMLDWEPTIGTDLRVLYPAYPAPTQTVPPVATSTATTTAKTKTSTKTATSTPPVVTVLMTPPQFVDEVVANHNARALKDSLGRTILLYGYADQQTLIIARDEAAFTLLLERLEASQQ